VVNTNEVLHLYDVTTSNGLTYAPFNLGTSGGNQIWTSLSLNGTSAYYNNRNSKFFRTTGITALFNSMFVRTFNWDGASLT
jgi:hypothetical protein